MVLRWHRVTGCVVCVALLLGMTAPVTASTWTNADGDDDWSNPNNWAGGDFTGGAGIVPTQGGSVGAAIGADPLVLNQAGLDSLYLIVNGQVDILGGDLVYTGDGLLGSDLGGAAGGPGALITQTGGMLTQTGGGAGFLVGHNAGIDYTITDGSIIVEAGAPSLTIDWVHDGTSSNPSTFNIGGNAVVDVAGEFFMGPGGSLNVTDNGVLIWRDQVLADVTGESAIATYTGPRIDPSATFNALAIQVGNDVHFVAVPEPAALVLLGMAMATVIGVRYRKR